MRCIIAALALAFAGAFASPTAVVAQALPVPTLTGVSPASVMAGATTTITLTGTNFVSGKTNATVGSVAGVTVSVSSPTSAMLVLTPVLVAGQTRVSIGLSNVPPATGRAMSQTQSVAVVAPAVVKDASAPGLTVGVSNPGPGGGSSGLVVGISNPGPGGGPSGGGGGGGGSNPTLTPTNGVPYLSTIAPKSAPIGASLTLTVSGNNFSGNSVVLFGATTAAVVSSSSTSLTAVIPAAAMTTPGNVAVSVFNPAPGGGSSGAIAFTVTGTLNPTPAVAGVSPATIPAGSGPALITVTGSGFIGATSASLAGVRGAVALGAITFALPASLTGAPGVLSGIITNPTPGGGGASFSVNVLNGVPTVTGYAPNKATAGSPGMSIAVSGSNFGPGSTITFGGTPIPTRFLSASALAGELSANFLQGSGNFSVGVSNPAPGGGSAAGSGMFAITSALPTLTAMNPAQLPSLGSTTGVTVTLTGTGFAGNTTGASGSTRLATVYSSATSLTVTIPPALLQRAGAIPITVTNPPPGGGTSAPITLAIVNPIPTLTSVSPASLRANQTSGVLTVTGTRFVPGATVNLGGTVLSTTYVSATELTATLSAPLPLGKPAVAVTNPTPGGGPSNAVTIEVSALLPTIASITPTSVAAGQTITVTGTNFGPGSVVLVNGTAIATSVASTTQLSAVIPAGMSPGAASIAVQNPATSTSPAATTTTVSISVVSAP